MISQSYIRLVRKNKANYYFHSNIRLVVESKESARAGVEAEGAVLVASLNLVDLAGSESVRHTGATGQRAKEGGKMCYESFLSSSELWYHIE